MKVKKTMSWLNELKRKNGGRFIPVLLSSKSLEMKIHEEGIKDFELII
jgi:hypothetical protein